MFSRLSISKDHCFTFPHIKASLEVYSKTEDKSAPERFWF
jgi:hypothetical protein